MTIEFVVPGKTVPMARPRVTSHGTYTPKRCRDYKTAVAIAAKAAMSGKDPLEGAVSVRVMFVFAVPTSWNKERRTEAACGRLAHVSKPDLDNMYKAVADACIGIVYKDDSQIVEARIEKRYAGRFAEGAYVSVREVCRNDKVPS